MMFKEPLPPSSNNEVTNKIKDENIRGTFRRLDCRKNNQIRDMFLKLGDIDNADGYCFYSLGNTKVLCTICGPKPENRGSYSETGRVRLKVATLKQNPLDNVHEQGDKEIEALLMEVINHIIFLEKYKGCCIYIRCIILKGDGGELSAVLTSISLALIKAGIETRDIISSISVCLLRCLKTNRTFNLVDLDKTELAYYKNKYEINLLTLGICFNAKTVCFFNGTCSSINNISFAEILNFAEGACRALGDMLKKSVQEHILKKHFSLPGLKKLKNKRNRKTEEELNTNYQKNYNQLTDKTTEEKDKETKSDFKRKKEEELNTNNQTKNQTNNQTNKQTNNQKTYNQLIDKTIKEKIKETKIDFKREDTETEEDAIEKIEKIYFKKERKKCIDITGSRS